MHVHYKHIETDAAPLFSAEAPVVDMVDMSKAQVSPLVMFVMFNILYRTRYLSMVYNVYIYILFVITDATALFDALASVTTTMRTWL